MRYGVLALPGPNTAGLSFLGGYKGMWQVWVLRGMSMCSELPDRSMVLGPPTLSHRCQTFAKNRKFVTWGF